MNDIEKIENQLDIKIKADRASFDEFYEIETNNESLISEDIDQVLILNCEELEKLSLDIFNKLYLDNSLCSSKFLLPDDGTKGLIITFNSHSEYMKYYLNWSYATDNYDFCKKMTKQPEYKDFFENYIIKVFVSSNKTHYFETGKVYNFMENTLPNVQDENILNFSRKFEFNIYDLCKLYDLNSLSLFSDNVRLPMGKTKFKEDMCKEIYCVYKSLGKEVKEIDEYFNSIFKITEHTNKKQWFNLKHNGITLATDGKIRLDRNYVILNQVENISILNGAQTISTLFNIKEECIRYIEKKNNSESAEDAIKNCKSIMTKIYKMILIDVKIIGYNRGSENYIREISYGLNNQNQVKEYDKYLGEIEVLNFEMRKANIKIIKTGENQSNFSHLPLIQFLKFMETYEGRPGAAKNLNSASVKSKLDNLQGKDDYFWKNFYLFLKNVHILEKERIKSKQAVKQEYKNADKCEVYAYSKLYVFALMQKLMENNHGLQTYHFYFELIFNELEMFGRGESSIANIFKSDNFFNEIKADKYDLSKVTITDIEEYLERDKVNLIKLYNQKKVKNLEIFVKKAFEDESIYIGGRMITVNVVGNYVEDSLSIGFFSELIEAFNNEKTQSGDNLEGNLFNITRNLERKILQFLKDNFLIFLKIGQNGELEDLNALGPIYDLLGENVENNLENILDVITKSYIEEDDSFINIADGNMFSLDVSTENEENYNIKFSNGDEIRNKSIKINKEKIQDIYDSQKQIGDV